MSSRRQATAQSINRFSERDIETIKASENEQRKFKKFIASSKDYSKTEKSVVKFDTVADFDAFWQKTIDAREEFDRSHESGCGLWSKKYQTSAVTVQSFMRDFSPIINIVKDFTPPYGGMAVGTISVFFAVAEKKDGMEECLASAISAINDRLPGLKLYQHIYNDNDELDMQLQARIVTAYKGFIDFCIVATKYYKGGGPRRWLKALGGPNKIIDKANSVQVVIVEIRRLCDELLDKNVHLIKQLNIEQKETIEGLKDEIIKLQTNHTLTQIQQLLGLSDFSDENQRKDRDTYHEALEASHNQFNAVYFEQMRGRRFDSFKAGKDYQSWVNSEHSCLLILSGYNNRGIRQIDYCWLSRVAMALIMELEICPSHPICAYYVFPQQNELLFRAFSVILLQLLRQKSLVLRNRSQCDELLAELYELQKHEHRDKKVMETEDERLSAFQKVALRVTSFFDESETVYVIIDRADRCCNYLRQNSDYRKPLLKALIKMVEAARCKLRVLVVINGSQWDISQRRDELGEKMKERVIIHLAEQGIIG